MKYRLWVWSKSKGQFTISELPLGFMEGGGVLHLHHAAEAHEGHSEDAGGDERDGNALH